MTRHLTVKVIHKRATEAVQMRRKVTEIAKRPAVNRPRRESSAWNYMLCAALREVESLSGTNRSMNAVTAMVAIANQMKSLMRILKTSSCSHTLMLSPQYHFGGMVNISSDHRPRMEIMMPDSQLRWRQVIAR